MQLPFQIHHIVVPVAQHLAVAGGVVFPVAEHIVVPANQSADDAQVGLESGGEGNHRVLAEKCRQFPFQLQVQGQGAVEEPGAGAAGSIPFKGRYARRHDIGIGGKPKIVVGAQHDAAFALHDDLYILPGFQGMKIGIDAHALYLFDQGEVLALFE